MTFTKLKISFQFILYITIILIASACIKQTDLFVEDGNIVYFTFEKAKNSQISKDINMEMHTNARKIIGYLTEDVDISSLVATFKTERGKLYVKNRLQESGKSSNDFRKPLVYILQEENKKKKEYTIQLIPYTGLPVVIINTDSETPIKDRETWINASLEINGIGIWENFKDSVSIRGRGNGTWRFPKKPFNIKLKDKAEILGMPKQKRWSFLANYRDRTLLRNDVTFQIGYLADNLEWTPKSQFVEVIFNGEHQGNFQLCEQIRVDKNRVNIKELANEDIDEEKITGGYLLEYDSYFDESNRFETTINKWPVNIKEPDEETLNKSQLEYIQSFTNNLERLLQSGEYEKIYNEYIDINSFIDYWMVQALVGNKELAYIYSIYCYKDRDKKLKAGPLWDFDYTTFTSETDADNKDSVWYKYLFNDPIFKNMVKQRFTILKPKLETIADYITTKSGTLTLSEKANWKLWPIDPNSLNIIPNRDETLTFQGAIERMRSIYLKRLKWLENEIYKL